MTSLMHPGAWALGRGVLRVALLALTLGIVGTPSGAFAQSPVAPEQPPQLAKKVDAASVGVPKPAVALAAGTSQYKALIDVGGQTIALDVTTTIREDAGTWVVTDTVKAPMGEASDTTVLAKDSLAPIRRAIKQGPLAIDVEFKGNMVTGKLTLNGTDQPISADAGGPLFADGAGAPAVMATLPLADGYSATFRNFDVQARKGRVMRLAVVGVESVTVPAGTFDAYKLEVTSAEGEAGMTTVWVDKATRKVVKTSAALPQMNGATMTMELAR